MDTNSETTLRPWGFWLTLVFSGLVTVIEVVVAVAGLVIYYHTSGSGKEFLDFAQGAESDGFFLCFSQVLTTLVCVPVIFLFARFRGARFLKDYLGLYRPAGKVLLKWFLLLVAFMIVSDTVAHIADQEVVTKFMIETYQTANSPFLVFLALVVMAPIFEEFMFRGFLFKGIECSRLGPVGAIILTALVWSAIHTQYNYFHIADIFIGGLLLGIARIKTNSIYVPIAMHMLMNLVATVQVVFYLKASLFILGNR
jgi:membrane protease YdiL (CAAX protease family)